MMKERDVKYRASGASLLLTAVMLMLSSCSSGEFLPDGHSGEIGITLHEGAEISENLAIQAFRVSNEGDAYIIRLGFLNSGAEGYSDEDRVYMESLYPTLSQYGWETVLTSEYRNLVGYSSALTIAGVSEGASVRADKEVAGREAGTETGDLFKLYAVSAENALRYSYPDYRVAGRYYLKGEDETFSSCFTGGLSFPGVSEDSSLCFEIEGVKQGTIFYFEIPVEYAEGVSYSSDGRLPSDARIYHKTVSGSVTIDAETPVGVPGGWYLRINTR